MKPFPVVLALAALGCAANEPEGVDFDSSAGLVVVEIAGDGFVRYDGRRIPWEAAVLELRLRTRPMDADQRSRFVVQMRIDTADGDEAAEARAMRDRDRLIDQLHIMGVQQAKSVL